MLALKMEVYMSGLLNRAENIIPADILTRHSEDAAYIVYFLGPPALIGAFLVIGVAVLIMKKNREWRELEPYMRSNNELEDEVPLSAPPEFTNFKKGA